MISKGVQGAVALILTMSLPAESQTVAAGGVNPASHSRRARIYTLDALPAREDSGALDSWALGQPPRLDDHDRHLAQRSGFAGTVSVLGGELSFGSPTSRGGRIGPAVVTSDPPHVRPWRRRPRARPDGDSGKEHGRAGYQDAGSVERSRASGTPSSPGRPSRCNRLRSNVPD